MEGKSRTPARPRRDGRSTDERLTALEAERARLEADLAARTADLQRSEARFRDVIERNADAIIVVDHAGVIRFANEAAARMFRSTRADLTGTPFGFPLTVGESTELDLLANGDTRVVELRVVESEWEGEVACIASLRDITERKRAEEAARRLIGEQVARTAAEASARRFRFLAEASAQLSLPLDFTETLSTLARVCVQHLADWAAVYCVDERGAVQRLEVAHRDPALKGAADALRTLPITPGSTHPVLEVLRTRAPLLLTDVDDAKLRSITQGDAHFEISKQLGVSSVMLVPLIARDREIGAIGFISSSPQRVFTEEDLAAANDLAQRAALAIDNARLYRAAHEANQAKTNLLAVISHDLRTPLNSIMGHAELLSMGIPEPLGESSLERVERIRMSTMHLVYLIDELLSFARLDGGHEELHLHDFDARAIVREVCEVVEPLAGARALAFQAALPAEPARVTTDPDRLRQVLLNLIGNAIKYTERGEVRLELRQDGDRLAFAVHDTGIGIDPDHLEHIFEPFWQADPQQRARNGGTGLGLSVVRRLVRLLGGEVTVASEPGRGSTFTLLLPPAIEVSA